jgi:hypothetical protein
MEGQTQTGQPCPACAGHGHVVERWTGSHWLTTRGCDACGMRGDAAEYVRENVAAAREAGAL